MPDYLILNTDALDALSPADAYQAATQIHHQAKRMGAAYADQLAANLAAQYGQARAADKLGIAQSTLAGRVSRHKKETTLMPSIIATHTVTQYVPVLKREVTRTWEKSNAGVWSTEVDGARWVLHHGGIAGGWAGADRIVWEWGPAGSGREMPTIKAATEEEALKEATWSIDIHPAIQGQKRSEP